MEVSVIFWNVKWNRFFCHYLALFFPKKLTENSKHKGGFTLSKLTGQTLTKMLFTLPKLFKVFNCSFKILAGNSHYTLVFSG